MTENQKKAVFIINNEFRGLYSIVAKKLEKEIDYKNTEGVIFILTEVSRLKRGKVYNEKILNTCIDVIEFTKNIKYE